MGISALISLDEYLRTSFRPDRDFIDGETLERNLGTRKHGFAQAAIAAWFWNRKDSSRLQPFTEWRTRISPARVRIPDVVLCEIPIPEEDVLTTPPYLCIEIMSPDDTMPAMQERLDDYLRFGISNIWVIDPEKRLGWRITSSGWLPETEVMHTADGRVAMPLAEVLLP